MRQVRNVGFVSQFPPDSGRKCDTTATSSRFVSLSATKRELGSVQPIAFPLRTGQE
jgi:hypothetical protein